MPDDGLDLRVAAVLAVLGGEPLAEVARRQVVEPALLERWVEAFVDAGAAEVTNQPNPRAARQRDRFLAAYAHETRTPLGVASGWATVLREEELTEAERDRAVAKLSAALERLNERVEEMELLAASSLGRLELEPETVPADALLARTAPDAPVRLGADTAEVPLVEVDLDQFTRVLRDLWRTAGHPPAPQERWWEVRAVEPWVEFRARRRGDPVDVRVLGALFDPFDSNSDSTGVTMGLHLARALAVAHGGTIGVDQNDAGAAFWVRVPRRRPTGDAVPQPEGT
ncbi:signal transduction histidine kinase [Friedmanniella endophytica]|uniref:Sensor-like histidine kinase SenX3 n=1 Tax=Microlunatus kandeliicorticis TaxID=1759536 RepID=A0A7W3IPE8_9ACTN|nr:HAMP domain-containing sensor histidine kinase [Microlunatus kandeliicorticis]MBA8792819.1 signal transduction histidine kinase [Microlunatus kandeliicorticis]